PFGAEAHARRALLVGAGGGEHAVAGGGRHLDRGHADSRSAALDEERFAGRELRAVVDVPPDGETGFGERGRLDERPALRLRQRALDELQYFRPAGLADLDGAHCHGRACNLAAAQRRSTFPPERITPTRRPASARASSFFSKRAHAASAPVGSTTIFIRSHRKNIARSSSSSVTVSMSSTYSSTSGKVSLPSEDVRAASEILSGT